MFILKVTVSRDRSYTLCHVIRCPKWSLLEDDLTIHAWNRWPLVALERWPLKRVKLYSNISWACLKVTVRLRWPVRQVRLYIVLPWKLVLLIQACFSQNLVWTQTRWAICCSWSTSHDLVFISLIRVNVGPHKTSLTWPMISVVPVPG